MEPNFFGFIPRDLFKRQAYGHVAVEADENSDPNGVELSEVG